MSDIPDRKPDDQAPKPSRLDSKVFQMFLGLAMAVVLIGGIFLLRRLMGLG